MPKILHLYWVKMDLNALRNDVPEFDYILTVEQKQT